MNQSARVVGINHLTFAVSDLERSPAFYVDGLGLTLVARRTTGAYLRAGATWVALSVDSLVRSAPHQDYTHTAFSVPAATFACVCERIPAMGAEVWQQNESEGDSLYVLDPDGHRLELHVTSLEDRLRACRNHPPEGWQMFE